MSVLGRDSVHRRSSEAGFTIIELLVVTVIIGILAAIALPSFLDQRSNAQDADAKALVRAGIGALESFAVERGGYDATRAQILADAPELSEASGWSLRTTFLDYTVSVEADSGHEFTVTRGLTSAALRTCTGAGDGGCGSDGTW